MFFLPLHWGLSVGLGAFLTAGLTLAQTTSLLDDFNRPDAPNVCQGWVETETTAGAGATVMAN